MELSCKRGVHIDEMFDFGSGLCYTALSADREFPETASESGEKAILDWLVDDLVDTTDIDEFVVISNHKFVQHLRTGRTISKDAAL